MRRAAWVSTLVTGIAIGLGLGGLIRPQKPVSARGADRIEESVFASGPIAVQNHPSLKVPLYLDALYFLDYKKGKLMASVPSYRQSSTSTSTLGQFSSRDLIADFQLPAGITPHFVMTVGDLGASSINGWSPLYVLETETRRIAGYRVEPAGVGPSGELPPRFELMEIRTLP